MRVTKPHYDILEKAYLRFKALYQPTDSDILKGIDPYQERIRAYQANPKFKDWRIAFMWDVYRALCMDMTIRDMMHDGKYLDAHIETALKKIIGLDIYPTKAK